MSNICATTNISILIFVSTCKQKPQSEPTKFSKNGVFYSKAVVITFSNCLNQNPILTTHILRQVSCGLVSIMQLCAILRHFCRKYIEIEFLKNFYLRKFLSSNDISRRNRNAIPLNVILKPYPF